MTSQPSLFPLPSELDDVVHIFLIVVEVDGKTKHASSHGELDAVIRQVVMETSHLGVRSRVVTAPQLADRDDVTCVVPWRATANREVQLIQARPPRKPRTVPKFS